MASVDENYSFTSGTGGNPDRNPCRIHSISNIDLDFEIDSNLDPDFDPDFEPNSDTNPDLDLISMTQHSHASDAQLSAITHLPGLKTKTKESLDLQADSDERQHGLFKHFAVISRNDHLFQLHKDLVADKERHANDAEQLWSKQLILEAER